MSKASKVKKLVLVLVTFTLVTGTREKAVETAKVVESAGAGKDGEESEGKYSENFAQVLCLCYPINLRKTSMLALLDLDSKVNDIYLTFAKQLSLPIRPIDVGA